MDNLNNTTKESNDVEIHIIDVKENVKEVAQSKEDAIKSEESASQSLESDLAKEMASLPPNKEIASLPPNKDGKFGIIYKVSEKYRKAKEDSYTPRVVSIGPLHRGKIYFQSMETVKLKCLNNLVIELGISLKTLSEYATAKEGQVRSYYQDFKFDAKKFSKIILLDGIFIIALISNNQRFKNVKLISDQNAWMLSDIKHDMLLLENQLPLFFVRGLLYELVNPDPEHTTSDAFDEDTTSDAFDEDLCKYFQNVGSIKRLKVNSKCKSALHLVDFLLQLHSPSKENQELKKIKSFEDSKVEYTRSSSALQGVGVRFCITQVEGLFAVTFKKDTGELCIPQLIVNDTTDTLFRNLIAFEQSRHEKHITSYVILMDSLINTAEDVKLLVEKGIIVNSLGEDHLVADLFNNLHKEVIEDVRDFYFAELCNELNMYKDCFHQWRSSCFQWMVMLKNKYFSNPWSVISFVAATVVVVLTIVQTVCALEGLKK